MRVTTKIVEKSTIKKKYNSQNKMIRTPLTPNDTMLFIPKATTFNNFYYYTNTCIWRARVLSPGQ